MDTLRLNLTLICLLMILMGLMFNSESHAAGKRTVVENQLVRMVIIPRTPQQMAAFYEGREFPSNAIEATRSACFFTVGIKNKTDDILWLNTQQWKVSTGNKNIPLISKNEWKQHWQRINLPQRFQSTFRWTLLPNKLDFQPSEREGGNITIARQNHPFNLIAKFTAGVKKQGKTIRLEFKNLRCAQDSSK